MSECLLCCKLLTIYSYFYMSAERQSQRKRLTKFLSHFLLFIYFCRHIFFRILSFCVCVGVCVCPYKPYQSLAYKNLFTVSISLCLLFFAIVHFITFYSYSLSSLYIFLSYVYYTTVYVLMLLSREYIIIYMLSEPETEFLSLNSVTHTHTV